MIRRIPQNTVQPAAQGKIKKYNIANTLSDAFFANRPKMAIQISNATRQTTTAATIALTAGKT
jgi:hypothetical protein